MKKLFLTVAIFSVLGFIATYPLQSRYHVKAKLIQRIQKTASGEMFGDDGTPIGAPTVEIIEDEKAFVGAPEAKGNYKVDENYLTEHKIHPLQIKTVDFFASCARIGFVIAGTVGGLFAWRLKQKIVTKTTEQL